MTRKEMFRWMIRALVLVAIITAAVAYPLRRALASTLPATVFTQYTCTYIWSQPSRGSTPIADVIGGTEFKVTSISSDGGWYEIQFLSAIPAWVPLSMVDTTPPSAPNTDGGCPFPNAPQVDGTPIQSDPGPYAMQGMGTITQPVGMRSGPRDDAAVVASLTPGARVAVVQYAADANGDIWLLATYGDVRGWLWAYAVTMDGPDPGSRMINGKPIWQPVAGKGMWIMNYFTRHTDIQTLVNAAKAAGITHLYPEVAISNDGGFFGADSLNRLIPIAHAAGISVVAWIYPYLKNVGADIAMTRQVYQYRTPNGDKPDGIVADIEERLDASAVYSYGQVVRQMVGPDYLLIATTYNPRAKRDYPFAEVAANFNVIAPQDYWHADKSATYAPEDAMALLLNTVIIIDRELGNRRFPIEELGQMYDMFTSNGAPGGTEPTGAEIRDNMRAAQAFGCIGVSYFMWQTASPAELDAFNAFKWK
jgi:hypothetical protein